MLLKQALLFSTQGKAHAIIGDYKVTVRVWAEDYTPLFPFGPGPFYRDAYELTIQRTINGQWQEPHVQHREYGELFFTWLHTTVLPLGPSTAATFGTWQPDEDEPTEEQTA